MTEEDKKDHMMLIMVVLVATVIFSWILTWQIYIANQTNLETIERLSEGSELGLSLKKLMLEYSLKMGTPADDLILTCQEPKELFNQSFATCFIRDKALNYSGNLVIDVNFNGVE